MKQYDVVVYRGRFQGMHDAHLKTILMALQFAKKVIVVVGSANEARNFWRNPFYENERIEMIRGALEDHFRHEDVSFVTVEDNPDDDVWAENVVYAVEDEIDAIIDSGYAQFTSQAADFKIAQIGYKKDANCVRDVDLFPTWEYIETPQFAPLDATHVRDVLFSAKPLSFLYGVCPMAVIDYLHGFRASEAFASLMAEKKFIEDYKRKFDGLEYAPTFVTGDNVAFKDGKVLLVKRKGLPGKGLWALPAGFFNAADRMLKDGTIQKADKTVFDCALRELHEETKASLSRQQLIDACMGSNLYEAEGRDARGRIFTHAFAYNLDGYEFTAEADDDAEELGWFDVEEIDRRKMYADHYDIILWAYGLYCLSQLTQDLI